MYTANSKKFGHIIQKPLGQNAYMVLKSEILKGDIGPGEILREVKLAKKLGTSRTPIREAILKLQQDGLVTPLANKGFKVMEFSNDKIQEIFGIRSVLEGYAGSLAVQNIKASQIGTLEKNISKTEYYFTNWDMGRLFELNSRFHDIIIEAAQSELLLDMISNLRSYIQRYRIAMLYTREKFHISIEHHKRILSALKAKDATGVEEAIREHIIAAREILLSQTKKLFP
jgi:DNA-binding GntR family transcriptional regulator